MTVRRHFAKKNEKPYLILGVVENYAFYEISRFLVTLRQSSYSGHICLFAGPNISRATIRKIRGYDLEVIPYGRQFPFIETPHPDVPTSLPNPIHIYNYRHFLYYDYLLKHREQFRHVLLTDVKDVVFQGHPFNSATASCLQVAMENEQILIGDCPWTAPWVLAGYGAELLASIADKNMSCAGTTMGPTGEVIRYLRLMLRQIQRMKDAFACADQAAHNLLLHQGALEPVQRLRNFEGPILTVGTEPKYRVNAQGQLVNRDNSVIAVIHQYDRHRELLRLFDAKTRPSAWNRYASALTFRLQSLPGRLRARLGRRS